MSGKESFAAAVKKPASTKKQTTTTTTTASAVNSGHAKMNESSSASSLSSFNNNELAKEILSHTSADYYADSYAHFGIHEEMLQDEVRTMSYMNAITRNPHLFKDKIVLDVGCGTGILSMFAAQAGAKLVIGVDMSSIAETAKVIVKNNQLDSVVKIIRGKIEEVELPLKEGEKVDIIISEWMGYFLLYESMLDSVLFARDKYLAKGGTLYPDLCAMYICGVEDANYRQQKLRFWDNVYGFDMKCIKDIVLSEPLVDIVSEDAIMSSTHKLIEFDLNTVTKEELDFHVPFSLVAERQDFCHGLLVYFDITFSACHSPIYFTTRPGCPYTHWKQTTFWLKDVLTICEGEKIQGHIKVNRNAKNPRDLDIVIDYEFTGKYQKTRREWNYRLR